MYPNLYAKLQNYDFNSLSQSDDPHICSSESCEYKVLLNLLAGLGFGEEEEEEVGETERQEEIVSTRRSFKIQKQRHLFLPVWQRRIRSTMWCTRRNFLTYKHNNFLEKNCDIYVVF